VPADLTACRVEHGREVGGLVGLLAQHHVAGDGLDAGVEEAAERIAGLVLAQG